MERWVEHYHELYSTENAVFKAGIEDIPAQAEMTSLDVERSREEMLKTMHSLAHGKASGNDGSPPEIIKDGQEAPVPLPHYLLLLC